MLIEYPFIAFETQHENCGERDSEHESVWKITSV